MIRPISASLVLLSLLVAGDAMARSRAVRSPAPPCTFSLTAGFSSPVAQGGFADGAIAVTADPSTCTSWNAYSLTDWVTVERIGHVAAVDVAPNPTPTSRTATLLIAGIRYELTQDPSQVVSPPVEGNLLRNPGFDSDLSFWGWEDRYPNGNGSASWAPLDAESRPGSGSISIRNSRPPSNEGPAHQQLQCVRAEADAVYEYGGKFFAGSTTAGTPLFSVVEYADESCGTAVKKSYVTPRVRTAGVWQSQTTSLRLRSDTKSVLMIIGSFASPGQSFEVFIDDVFLRKR